MPPPAGPARRQFLNVAAVPSKSGRKPASGCGLTMGSGPGNTLRVQQVARAATERDTRQHRVGRADGREERGADDVAVGRVVDPAEVVGHRVGELSPMRIVPAS